MEQCQAQIKLNHCNESYPILDTIQGKFILEKFKYPHPDDAHLTLVLAYYPEKDEFVTWVYNSDIDSLNIGHYFSHYQEAKRDFEIRKW